MSGDYMHGAYSVTHTNALDMSARNVPTNVYLWYVSKVYLWYIIYDTSYIFIEN